MFTIITPTYNRAVLLQNSIRSIISQTYKDWELIVVDDGSTDNTEDVMQQYITDVRIKYIKKPNSGQAKSLNAGALYAQGDFITFLDSDDEAYPNWLEAVHEQVKHDTGIICAAAMRSMLDGALIKEDLAEYKLLGKKMRLKFTSGSLIIRRSLFNAVGGYDEMLKSNIQTDLGYRLVRSLQTRNLKAVTLDKYLVQINVHPGERIRTNWQKRVDGGVQFINKHYLFIKQNDPEEISNIYSSIAFASYKMKKRIESVGYMIQAIKHNPVRWINYVRIIKYAFI